MPVKDRSYIMPSVMIFIANSYFYIADAILEHPLLSVEYSGTCLERPSLERPPCLERPFFQILKISIYHWNPCNWTCLERPPLWKERFLLTPRLGWSFQTGRTVYKLYSTPLYSIGNAVWFNGMMATGKCPVLMLNFGCH